MRNFVLKKPVLIIGLFILALFSVLIGISVGAYRFTLKEVLTAFFQDKTSLNYLIIIKTRLPRVLVGGLVGISLSLSGCLLQGVMKNNLASPSTLGITSGSVLMAYITLVMFPSLSFLLPLGSILGAFLTTLIIFILASGKKIAPLKMILAGLAVSAFLGACSDLIKTYFQDNLVNVQNFLIGSLNAAGWSEFYLISFNLIIVLFAIWFLPVKLNLMSLSDDHAKSLGLNLGMWRFLIIMLSSVLIGVSIAVSGMISFVGLIVPHMARLIVGDDYKKLLTVSSLIGFSFVILADTIGRIIIIPSEISVSIILSLLGAPFFLSLLRRSK